MKVHVSILVITLVGIIGCSGEEESSQQRNKTIDNNDPNQVARRPVYTEHFEPVEFDPEMKEKRMSPSNYVAMIRDRKTPLTKYAHVGNLAFYATYLPDEYLVSNELRKSNVMKAEFDSLLYEYEGLTYFMIEIETPERGELAKYELESKDEYSKRIEYLSFGMQSDLKLLTESGEVYPCILYHYERTFGASPKNTFLIAFELPEDSEAESFDLNLAEKVFTHQLVEFNWEPSELENMPKVKLS